MRILIKRLDMKKYDKEYIQESNKQIWEILGDKRECSDYTQICLSIQDAIQAAADIWGLESDEQIHKMSGFIKELVYAEIKNIQQFDIAYKKKEEYLIKFTDGRYLKRARYNYEIGKYFIAKTENISDALVFKKYSKAETLRADLISISCNEECEIIVKP